METTNNNGIGYVHYEDGWHRTCEACARMSSLELTDVEHDPDECEASCHICGHTLSGEPAPGDPPYPWCVHSRICIFAGRCTRAINCGD